MYKRQDYGHIRSVDLCVLPVHALAQVRECRLAPSFHAFVVGGDFFSSGHLSLEHPHARIFAVGTDVALCLSLIHILPHSYSCW